MDTAFAFLLLLPALVYGKFTIDIDLTNDPLVDVRGEFKSEFNDIVREAFQIRDQELIKAVTKYGKGAEPVKVYVKKDKNLDEVYRSFSIVHDVERHVKPMLDVEIKPDCSHHEKIHSDHADMTISSDWKKGGDLSVELEYDVYLASDPAAKLTFNSSAGQSLQDKVEYSFGKFVENALKCTVDLNVKFESTLKGDVVAQYPSKKGDHYFWAYDLGKLNLTTTRYNTEETIRIVYFKEDKGL